MQSYIADNISPICQRVLIYFRQIANRFVYGAISDQQR